MKEKIKIKGMECAACCAKIEKHIKKINGVENINVNLLNKSATVEYDEQKINHNIIVEEINKLGYEVKQKQESDNLEKQNDKEYQEIKNRAIYSIIFGIILLYISMGPMINLPLPNFLIGEKNMLVMAFTQFLVLLPILLINKKYFISGFKGLINKNPNMDSLVAIGCFSATIYGIYIIYKLAFAFGKADFMTIHKLGHDLYFESASSILALISLGKYLEAKAKGKTKDAINKLIDLKPKKTTLLKDGEEIEIDIEKIEKNDILIVKTGQSIPTDGIILEGRASIDESFITGESLPSEKNVDDEVIGGSILTSGHLKIKALKVGEETLLSQIIKLIEEATSKKAPIATIADKISSVFVPIIITFSILCFFAWLIIGKKDFEFSLTMAISVLVISCPCALGLATPTAIMVSSGKAATNGILIKNAEALEKVHKIKTIIFDKTGTLTNGKMEIEEIICSENIKEEKILEISSSIEKMSEHPIAKAFVKKAEEKKINFLKVENFNQLPGFGLKATVSDAEYLIGNKKILLNEKIEDKYFEKEYEKATSNGKIGLYLISNKKILGLIILGDTIKQDAKYAIEKLKNNHDLIMLTGDNKNAANYIGNKIGIEKIIAEILPTDKANIVKKIQEENKNIIMVGDGVNDAAALIQADVGIAIGSGSDIAIESAEIILIKNDLINILNCINLSNKTLKNIKQNLFWAFFYNIVCIPVAAGFFYNSFNLKLNPMIASFAMSFSSIFVVMNALRLNNFKFINNKTDQEKRHQKSFIVKDMSCKNCSNKIEKALKEINEIHDIKINLKSKEIFITSKENIEDEKIIQKLNKIDYKVSDIKNHQN